MRKLFAAIAILLALDSPALALTSSPTACVTPKLWLAKSTGPSIADVNVIVTPASGVKITGIMMSVTLATGDWYGVVDLKDGSTTVRLGHIHLPAGGPGWGQGLGNFNYMAHVSGLPIDSDGNPYILMTPTHTLTFAIGSAATGTAGGDLQIMIIGCQFE